MKRVLLTGIDGFIGHHVAEGILKNTDWKLVGLSKIDSASTLHRLSDIDLWSKQFAGRVEFIYHDLRAPINPYVAGAKVTAKVIKHGLGEKIVVRKFKRRKRYHKTLRGHRQGYTEIEITGVGK